MSNNLILSFIFLFSFLFGSNLYGRTTEECDALWDDLLGVITIDEGFQTIIGKCDKELIAELKGLSSNNRPFDYKKARTKMFSDLDNFDGTVCGVYSGTCIRTVGIPDGNKMNCEHSWPQSLGAVGIAKTDLHHLYPVDSRINSRRSNHPFCEVSSVTWQGYGSFLGKNELGTTCFEPRLEHKGNLARSMIYFAVRYGHEIDVIQENFFRKWMVDDPVDQTELERHQKIQDFQGNSNPFVLYPELVELISDF